MRSQSFKGHSIEKILAKPNFIEEEEEEKLSPSQLPNSSGSKAKKAKKMVGVNIKNNKEIFLNKEQSSDKDNDYALEAHTIKTDLYDEKEIRIYQWLDSKKINMADPKELIYAHFEKARETIFKNAHENSDSPSKKVDLVKSGLLSRRKKFGGECQSASPELMKAHAKRTSCDVKLVSGLSIGKSEFIKWAQRGSANTLETDANEKE